MRECGATLNFASKRADAIMQSGEKAVKAEERVFIIHHLLLGLLILYVAGGIKENFQRD